MPQFENLEFQRSCRDRRLSISSNFIVQIKNLMSTYALRRQVKIKVPCVIKTRIHNIIHITCVHKDFQEKYFRTKVVEPTVLYVRYKNYGN